MNDFRSSKNKSGQATLIIVLAIMLIGLGIGIATFGRSTTTLRESTYNVQSEQAFSCAESGIDNAIQCISNNPGADSDFIVSNCSLNPGKVDPADPNSCEFVTSLQKLTDSMGFSLQKDQTEVIVLNGAVSSADVNWSLNDSTGNLLEINVLTSDGSGGYNIKQLLVGCGSPLFPDTTKGNPLDASGCSTGGSLLSSIGGAEYLQLTAREDNVDDIQVTLNGTPPVQGYNIVSKGTQSLAQRELEVNYMLPSILRLFNNTLYASSVSSN